MISRLTLVSCIVVAQAALAAPTAMAVDAATASYPPLAARYREHSSNAKKPVQKVDWYLVRRADEVATARGHNAEVWTRDERGEISLTRVYHDDRKVIVYSAGELRTQRRYPDWDALNAVFDPRANAALKPTGKLAWRGHAATRYKGLVSGRPTEVVWLDKLMLAARIVRGNGKERVTLEIVSLGGAPETRWPKVGLADTEDYAQLDGADLGDMEYDPFVQRVLARDSNVGGGHAHHSH